MQIINYTLPQNNPNMSFKALQISSKAREEVAYMGRVVKDDYEKNLKKRKALDNAIDSLRRSVFVKPSLHDEDSYFAVLYEMVEENR